MVKVLCRCGQFYERGSNCQACGPGKKHGLTTAQRGYDHHWRRLSERIRTEEVFCVDCLEKGFSTPAEECHHVIKIKDAPGLRLDRGNVMPLCKECHKTRTERGE